MLVRLLVAVLTLVGPMPFRACTCAAAHGHHAAPSHAPDDTSTPVDHSGDQKCRCAHQAPADGARSSDDTTAAQCDGRDHPTQHERDCPAANPGPVVREAVPQAATDAPAEGGNVSPVAWAESPPGVVFPPAPASECPRAPKNPLYLTLLTLRN